MTDDAEPPGYPRIAPPEPEGGVVVPLRSRDRDALLERERRRAQREARRNRPRRIMRWRRFWLLLIPLGILAVISTVFGIVIALASDLPRLNSFIVTNDPQNTLIYDDDNHRIAVMTDVSHEAYFVKADQIPMIMQRAVVSIEDKRFYTESGVDIRGIARAFLSDVTGGGNTQGGSTITEQLVKVMKQAEFHRTILEKLTEAALAFQLSHKWSKEEILAEYLNNVYFGNGAYGIEAAAQTYFGNDPSSNLYDCGYNPDDLNTLCVSRLTSAEAALLAGLVQNPPVNWAPPVVSAEQARRKVVLFDMYQQGYISREEYAQALTTPMPQAQYVITPGNAYTKPGYGYFTSWVEQQVLDDSHKLPNPYTSGYAVHTTLDEPLQNEAQNVVDSVLPAGSGLPTAAVVAINNQTGGVEAMVGGRDYDTTQFNLATQAERQPGSAWKVFDLAKALELGVSPNRVFPSAIWTWEYGPGPPFTIHNDEAGYAGTRTLAAALTYSDNTVFAHVGLEIDGPKNIANYAHDFGITTDISTNPSMVIGGLYTGVTPLDMAHAYETIAEGGDLVSGTLASKTCAGGTELPRDPTRAQAFAASLEVKLHPNSCHGPVGIVAVNQGDKDVAVNQIQTYAVPGFTPYMDQTEQDIMRTVVTEGTGTAAGIPGVVIAGKTGTTSNYVDAWFVGFSQQLTVAVWVGYVDDKPMKTEFNGKPVYGADYPSIIFHDFMAKALPTIAKENYDNNHHISQESLDESTASANYAPVLAPATSSATTTPAVGNTGTTTQTTTATGGQQGGVGATGTTTPSTPTPTGPGGGAEAP
jgi:penicillin-binding protein 1A